MKIEVELEVIHAAMHDDFMGELARLLSTIPAKIANQLERDGRCICEALESDDKLLDINGNTVGFLRLIPGEGVRDLLKKVHSRAILCPSEEGYNTLVINKALDIWHALFDMFGEKTPEQDDPSGRYVASKGMRCPFCDADNVVASRETDEQEDMIFRNVHCLHGCGKEWTEHFQLIGMDEVVE